MKKISVVLIVGWMLHGCNGGVGTSTPTPREEHRAAITKEVSQLEHASNEARQRAWSCYANREPCETFWVGVIREIKAEAHKLEEEVKSEHTGQAHRAGA